MDELSEERADFRNHYSELLKDIKFLKGRQWTITYYLLLLYVSIIGLLELSGFDKDNSYSLQMVVLLTASTIGIGVVGIFNQLRFHQKLAHSRETILRCLEHMTANFNKFDGENRINEEYKSERRGFCLDTCPLIVLLCLGCFLTLWYVFHKLI